MREAVLGRFRCRYGRRRQAAEGERGAVMVIFAIFLGYSVLFGMAAVVVDVGMLYYEREQLVSGADAASFKVALNCARTPATCTGATQTPVAVSYAGKNAKDGRADAQICINSTACPVWNTAATCPPLPAPAAGTTSGEWVEVRTSTRNANGTALVPPFFAGAVTGGAYQGRTVGACARAAWGPPVVGDVLALGVSMCDWKRMTSDGAVFYGPLGSVLDQAGAFHLAGLPSATPGIDSGIPQGTGLSAFGLPLTSCTTPPNPTEPRGYAWLTNPDLTMPNADCEVSLKVGDKPRSFLLAGIAIGLNCGNKLKSLVGSTVFVPVYDKIEPALVTLAPQYRIAGFAPFVVTGHTDVLGGVLGGAGSVLSGGSAFDLLNKPLCGLGACVYGYFTKSLVAQYRPQFGAGRNLGATLVGRTG